MRTHTKEGDVHSAILLYVHSFVFYVLSVCDMCSRERVDVSMKPSSSLFVYALVVGGEDTKAEAHRALDTPFPLVDAAGAAGSAAERCDETRE